MSIKPPLTELPINRASEGFYKGLNRFVTIGSKIILGLLIVWAAAFPDQAGSILKEFSSFLLSSFGTWYIYIMVFYMLICMALAIWPSTGKIRLGKQEDRPEFSSFSWFSMMFGAGIGIGMLTFATAEPLYHFANNPDVIQGITTAKGADNVTSAYRWSFLHWGFSAWACYALAGLSLAFFSYRRGLPLTVRSALTPLFGKHLSGPTGDIVDIVAVIATVLGVAVSIGFGVSQFASGIFNITGLNWILDAEGNPSIIAQLLSLIIIMGASTLSAMSGVGKGIKWLSNLNMALSIFVLVFFVLFGSTVFAFKAFFIGLLDYMSTLPTIATTIWSADGTDVGDKLAGWQGGWTILYWAWWIAFAPFVGLFLARISKGRTIREYVLGAIIAPSIMCFVWFALAGGTAINLELTGVAQGSIMGASITSQLYETMNVLLSPGLAIAMSVILVILMLTYLVTTADSAVLIVNTITAAGDEKQRVSSHIILWGVALTVLIGVLLIAGGLSAIKTAMMIGALPFSVVLALMGLALIKAVIRDAQREKLGSVQEQPLN